MSAKILIVEGPSDQRFFQVLCKSIKLEVDIRINTPKELGASIDGKSGAYQLLEILKDQLFDGSITHLAILLDADYVINGEGYNKTVEKVTEIVQTAGYDAPEYGPYGISFPHSNGLHPIGLWVMPDNKLDGMFEDWIKLALKQEEKDLLNRAIDSVRNLPTPRKFSNVHLTKAEVSTWLAWQKKPGEGPHTIIKNKLVDPNSQQIVDLINWLNQIYN